MPDIKITWQLLDSSVLKLPPGEVLQRSTEWASQRPSDEPWLATLSPVSKDGSYFAISLALDAFHAFTPEAVGAFSRASEHLLSLCSAQERDEMGKQERKKGNPGQLWTAKRRIFRVITPARLLSDAKGEIVGALSSVGVPVVTPVESD